MDADIVIVGGGPIGCWTAIQAKKRNPALSIRIYERHPAYQRDHMLRIHKASLTRYSKRMHDAPENAFYDSIANANSNAASTPNNGNLKPLTYIRTQDFENILKAECARLGIAIDYQKIETPAQIMAMHPECSMFIAADGTRSAMRTNLLGPDSVHTHHLFPTIDVQYQSKGQPRYLQEPTFNRLDRIVIENIEREKNGASSVALRFLLDEETYNKIPDATFKNPLTIADLRSEKHQTDWPIHMVVTDIKMAMLMRKNYAGDEFIEGSERITKIRLSRYASKKFALTKNDNSRKISWFITGDAAMGLPFYRSINSGLLLSSQLAAIVTTPRLSNDSKVTAYNALRPLKLAREFGAASAKELGIKAYMRGVRPALGVLAFAGFIGIIMPVMTVGNFFFPGKFRLM